jgi:hypothetical protein
MGYDIFSVFYERFFEDLYRSFRPVAVEALRVAPGACILDLPCGAGQRFGLLAPAGCAGRKGAP